jgi:hypothetical protein
MMQHVGLWVSCSAGQLTGLWDLMAYKSKAGKQGIDYCWPGKWKKYEVQGLYSKENLVAGQGTGKNIESDGSGVWTT